MDSKEINELQKLLMKNNEIHQLTLSLENERSKFKNELQAIHEYYDNIIALMPGHVYWLDKIMFLGCNDLQAKMPN